MKKEAVFIKDTIYMNNRRIEHTIERLTFVEVPENDEERQYRFARNSMRSMIRAMKGERL